MLEMIVVLAVIGTLCLLLLSALIGVMQKVRIKMKKTELFHNAKVELFLREDASNADMLWYATNTPSTFDPFDYTVAHLKRR